jgi:hypothetical protein
MLIGEGMLIGQRRGSALKRCRRLVVPVELRRRIGSSSCILERLLPVLFSLHVVGRRSFAGILRRLRDRPSAHGPQRLALSTLNLGRVSASSSLEVQVLTDRVVQQTHD